MKWIPLLENMSQTWSDTTAGQPAWGSRGRKLLCWGTPAQIVSDTYCRASFFSSSFSVILVQTRTPACCFTCFQMEICCWYFPYLLSVSLLKVSLEVCLSTHLGNLVSSGGIFFTWSDDSWGLTARIINIINFKTCAVWGVYVVDREVADHMLLTLFCLH